MAYVKFSTTSGAYTASGVGLAPVAFATSAAVLADITHTPIHSAYSVLHSSVILKHLFHSQAVLKSYLFPFSFSDIF